MSTAEKNRSGWFTVSTIANQLGVTVPEFLRLWGVDSHEKLEMHDEPVIHWREVLRFAEGHFGEQAPADDVLWADRRAEEFMTRLFGFDDWDDGVTGKVATNWDLSTGGYEVRDRR